METTAPIDILLTQQTIECILAGWSAIDVEWLTRERNAYRWNVLEETFSTLEEAHLRFQQWLWRDEVVRRMASGRI